MQKLGITDASFLYLERDGAPMNIASVQRFEKPTSNLNMASFHRRLKRYLAARVHGIEFMSRKLKRTPFDLDQPVWVTDSKFDISSHVFRTRLKTPGTERALTSLIAALHERPLDRNRPLWEMHLIDGLEDGTFVLYSKYHHAAVDGIAAQQIMNVLYADSTEQDPQPLPAGKPDSANNSLLLFDALVNLSLQPFEQLTRVGAGIRSPTRLSERFSRELAGATMARAPKTPFNVRVSPYRNYAMASLPLSEMRALGKRSGASVNDVLPAVCAGGLQRYLRRTDQLPETPLIAGIPVSLRTPGDRSFKNRVTMLRASLATDIEDPQARLAAITRSTRNGKDTLNDARALIPDDLHIPGLASLLRGASAIASSLPRADSLEAATNVVISNVPGPRKTKYLLGAKMLTQHPVSIAADGNALNITVQSYGGRLDLGITACLEATPDIEALKADMLSAWDELLSIRAIEGVSAAA